MTNPSEGQRLDVTLVQRGLVESRTRAQRLIGNGGVRVDDRVVTRPGHKVADTAVLVVTALDRWVSRGATKLLAACEHFDIDFHRRTVLDIGASTGGFTEVALSRGAARVVALDVGHGQLHPAIRAHHRVTAVEGFNIRELSGEAVAGWGVGRIDDVVIDVSFISLDLVLPIIAEVLGPVRLIALIKPQFEVGRGNLVDGIVRDAQKRTAAIAFVCSTLDRLGLTVAGVMESPIEGEHGNREAIVYANPTERVDAREWNEQVSALWGGG